MLFFYSLKQTRAKTDRHIQKPQTRLACENWFGSERFAEAVAGGTEEFVAAATVDLCSRRSGSTCLDPALGPDRNKNTRQSAKNQRSCENFLKNWL